MAACTASAGARDGASKHESGLASWPRIQGDVCVYGGTFDPPTASHAQVVMSLLELGAAKVVLVPGGPEANDAATAAIGFENKSNKTGFATRVGWLHAMASRIEQKLGAPVALEVNTSERDGRLATPTLLQQLVRGGTPRERLRVVVGTDNALKLHTWAGETGKEAWMSTRFMINLRGAKDPEELLKELEAQGWNVSDADQLRVAPLEALDLSSTDIRRKCNYLKALGTERDREASPERADFLEEELHRRNKSLRDRFASGVWDEVDAQTLQDLADVHAERRPDEAIATAASVRSLGRAPTDDPLPTLLSTPGARTSDELK